MADRSAVDLNWWRGRRVLVTGHTGFKGAWLTLWLERLGADGHGLALAPETRRRAFSAARRPAWNAARRSTSATAERSRPRSPRPTRRSSSTSRRRPSSGAATPTRSARTRSTCSAPPTCSRRRGAAPAPGGRRGHQRQGLRATTATAGPSPRTTALGGVDPYSASKAAAELAPRRSARSYFATRGVGVATARAGNVIGGGDWAADRLVPDVVRALRGRPSRSRCATRRPTRPWQHVLEPLHGYLLLAERSARRTPTSPPGPELRPDAAGCVARRRASSSGLAAVGRRPAWERRTPGAARPRDAALPRRSTPRWPRERSAGGRASTSTTALDWTVDWYRGCGDGGDAARADAAADRGLRGAGCA